MRISDWSSAVFSSSPADQQTGGAIVLLAAITAVAAAPDAGVGTDTLVARIIPVMALLAIEAGILVGLEQARSLRRCGGRKAGIGGGGGGDADRGERAQQALGDRKSTRLNSSH